MKNARISGLIPSPQVMQQNRPMFMSPSFKALSRKRKKKKK